MIAFLLCVQYRYWFTIGKVAEGLSSPYSICVLTFYAGSRNAEEITLGLAQSYARFWGCHTPPPCECGVHVGSIMYDA